MDNAKSEEIYHKFVELLRFHKLDWVIAQVEEQIRLGRTSPQRVQSASPEQLEFPDSDDESGTRRERPQTSRDTFLKRVDYTQRERLILIIAATEHVVVNVGEIGLHLAEFVGQRRPPIRLVQFVSEEENTPPKAIPLAEVLSRKMAIEKLRSLLAELKAEVIKDAH